MVSCLDHEEDAALEAVARHPHHQGRDLGGVLAPAQLLQPALETARSRASISSAVAGGGGRRRAPSPWRKPRPWPAPSCRDGALRDGRGRHGRSGAAQLGKEVGEDLVRERAQVGLELLRIQLGEAGLEDEVLRSPSAGPAPARWAVKASAMSSTGGRRFIFQRRLTTSNPPWNDVPPEVGMPRSVTSRNGMRGLAQAAGLLHGRVGVLRLDDVVARRARSARPGCAAPRPRRPRGGRWSCPPAGAAGDAERRRGGRAEAEGARARRDARGRARAAAAARSSTAGTSSNVTSSSAASSGGTVWSSGTSANEASRAAVESRRSSSIPRARSSSSSWALMPWGSVSSEMSRGPTLRGGPSVRLKLNWPSRRRMSCSRPRSMLSPEQRRPRLRRQLAVARVEGRRLRAEGGHDVAVLEDDGALSPVRADGEVPRLLAEGHDLQDVEEGQVLEVTVQAHDGVPWASSCIPA